MTTAKRIAHRDVAMVRGSGFPIIVRMFIMNRRQFLVSSSALLAGSSLSQETGDLIKSVTTETLWRNRDGKGTTWFHPRPCLVPGENGKPFVLMAIQEIGGSDYFGPVQ